MTPPLLSATSRQKKPFVSMSLIYPLNDVQTSLGIIPEPIIPVQVLTFEGYRSFDFLLDTGADCTMLPAYVAEILRIDLKKARRAHSMGIEGEGIPVRIHEMDIKIGNHKLRIKCLFSPNETTPFILGRLGLFSHFNILLDNKHKRIKLTKIK